MLPGDLLLSVNDVDLAKKKNIQFSEFCQRIAQSSTSTVRKFIVKRKTLSHSEELYFELPQGHLGMNFNQKTLKIKDFQNVPGPAQLAIPRIGLGDVLEKINGSTAGTCLLISFEKNI